MSPLFRDKEERAAKRAAADAEVERLLALTVWELAAEILPIFGAGGIHSGGMKRDWSGEIGDEIAKSLVGARSAGPSSVTSRQALSIPILEAIQALESAGLLLWTLEHRRGFGSFDHQQRLQITRLGQATLDEGRARVYLRDPAANPES